MDDQTLDRMIAAFEDSLRNHSSLMFPSLSDKRQAMLAALRAMWRPVEEVPMDCLPCIVTDAELDLDMLGYKTKGEWFDLYDDEPIEPTHSAPLLPTPKED